MSTIRLKRRNRPFNRLVRVLLTGLLFFCGFLFPTVASAAPVSCNGFIGANWVKYYCNSFRPADVGFNNSNLLKTKSTVRVDRPDAAVKTTGGPSGQGGAATAFATGYGTATVTFAANRNIVGCQNLSNYNVKGRCDYYTISA